MITCSTCGRFALDKAYCMAYGMHICSPSAEVVCGTYSNSVEEGSKSDKDKLRYDLIDMETLDELAKRFTHGAKKYGPNNWQLVANAEDRYYAALLRHLSAYRQGKRIDEDSGLTHISAVLWNAFALTWFDLNTVTD